METMLRLLSLLLSLFLLLLLSLLPFAVVVADVVVVNIAADAKLLIAELDTVELVRGVVFVDGGEKVDSLQTELESRRTKSKARSRMYLLTRPR